MAEVTQMDNLSTPMPLINGTEPEKRKRGRPPGSKKQQSAAEPEEDADDDGTPTPDKQDFWLMLQNFSDEEWNHLSAYVYRLAPKIDRKNNGRKANIQTYTSRFTQDDLMKDHGSGAYQIMLTYQDPGTGKYSRLAVEKVQIMNLKYPPVVPDGDWVDDKDNEMWKWGANAVPSTANGGSYPPGFNIADMMDKADQRALKMVEIMTPKAPPPKDDTVLTTLLTKLLDKSLTPPPAPDNSMMERIFKMQDDTLQALRTELLELRKNPAPPQKSIIEQFIEIRPQIKDLVDAFATKAGKTDLWAEIAKEGVTQIPDLIQLGREILGKKTPEPQQNGHHQAQPAAIAAAPTSNAPVQVPAKPVEQMTDEEKRAYIDQLFKKWGRHLLDINTRLIEEFTLNNTGYSFRDWYIEWFGMFRWADMKRDLDPELISNMYLAHENLRRALSPPERLMQFFAEFQTQPGEEPGEDEPGAVEPDEVIPAAKQNEAKTK